MSTSPEHPDGNSHRIISSETITGRERILQRISYATGNREQQDGNRTTDSQITGWQPFLFQMPKNANKNAGEGEDFQVLEL